MRVVQNKPVHPEKPAEVKKDEPTEEGQEEEETSTEVEKKSKDKIVVSGVLAKVILNSLLPWIILLIVCLWLKQGNADFPAEAVKAYHEKPIPKQQPVNHIPNNNIQHVNQPRKNNFWTAFLDHGMKKINEALFFLQIEREKFAKIADKLESLMFPCQRPNESKWESMSFTDTSE